MSEQGWDFEIELRKEPHRIKVGEAIYEFYPELDSDVFLEAFKAIESVRKETNAATSEEGLTTEQAEKVTIANRKFLSTMMLKESAKDFMEKPPPGRVIALMTEHIMEYFNGHTGETRPTGQSSDSAPGSSRTGRRSTGNSPSRG